VSIFAEYLGNVRAGLSWCFGDSAIPSRIRVGIELAAASVPMFLGLSLLSECHSWSKTALARLDDASQRTRLELVLQEALAISSSWTRGNGDDVKEALARGLELATLLGDAGARLRLFVGMHVFLLRVGDFRGSLVIAEQLQAVAREDSNASYRTLGNWLRGSSEHFLGNQAAAQLHFKRGFELAGARNMQLFGLDYRVRALVTYSRVLWLRGFPDQAVDAVREALREAAQSNKPLNVCFALLYTAPVFLWCGDLDAARKGLDELMAHPNWHALRSLRATGMALKGELLVELGSTEEGTTLLREALDSMRSDRQGILVARVAGGLAKGLAAMGKHQDAASVINEAIGRVKVNGETLELPELLRIRATILYAIPGSFTEADESLRQSLTCAREQSAKSWELRAVVTRARIQIQQGNYRSARKSLAHIYDQFAEGFETVDLRNARELLASLASS
jgi:tetratricopeptide (TPR) repeat protein